MRLQNARFEVLGGAEELLSIVERRDEHETGKACPVGGLGTTVIGVGAREGRIGCGQALCTCAVVERR